MATVAVAFATSKDEAQTAAIVESAESTQKVESDSRYCSTQQSAREFLVGSLAGWDTIDY